MVPCDLTTSDGSGVIDIDVTIINNPLTDTINISITLSNNPEVNFISVFYHNGWSFSGSNTLEGNSLSLYMIAYSSSELSDYSVQEISYQRKVLPSIEFKVEIEKDDNLLESIATQTVDTPSLLIPAKFTNSIEFIELNDTDIYNYSYNSTYGYNDSFTNPNMNSNLWRISVSATFDNCVDYSITNISTRPGQPGYARLILYSYNASRSYRSEILTMYFLQTECPATVDAIAYDPTYYDPAAHLEYYCNGSNYTLGYSTASSNNTNGNTESYDQYVQALVKSFDKWIRSCDNLNENNKICDDLDESQLISK